MSTGKDDVNLKSVDAMFATMIAEQKATREAVLLRMTAQDTELAGIRVQTTLTNGRVTALERINRDRVVRMGALVTLTSTIGGLVVWAVGKFLG